MTQHGHPLCAGGAGDVGVLRSDKGRPQRSWHDNESTQGMGVIPVTDLEVRTCLGVILCVSLSRCQSNDS